MGLRKYKYYFRKPKSEIAKDFLYLLAVTGAIYIASFSPYFIHNLMKNFGKKYPKKKVKDAFYNFKKQGLIKIKKKNQQIYIELTEKGKRKAGWMQINDLKIERPKKWDGKYRLLLFDISQFKKIYREALRGKLKELGFYPFQKSVWLHAFYCRAEVELLKEFFGLSDKEIRLIETDNIGPDEEIRKFFKLH